MRAKLWGVLLRGAAGLVGALGAAGCTAKECDPDAPGIRELTESTERAGLLLCPSGVGSSGDGGPNPACIPSDNKAPVDDACGIFVRAKGDDTNEGTKAQPVRTLSKALDLAQKKGVPVFACAEKMAVEPTRLSVEAGMLIFGGLDCEAEAPNTWAHTDAKKTEVGTPSNDDVPVLLKKGSGTELHDLLIVAEAASTPGKSSIAVIANEVTARFIRVTIEARDGAKGEDGAPFSSPAMAGEDGTSGATACTGNPVFGGVGPSNVCSSGGDGGSGGTTVGSSGTTGLPDNGIPNYGAGESSMAPCASGADGEPGMPGADGANGDGLGTLNAMDGYVGESGKDGTLGSHGRGGGGGGGSKSVINNVNQCPGGTSVGASGGSGASGGCGGAGGNGGKFGGSSIGVVSLRSTLTFESSEIRVGNGAAPGFGNNGQSGGVGGELGGAGGVGSGNVKAACKGGRGGNGGAGGFGGNGVGGHSIGIAYTVMTETYEPSGISDQDIKIGAAGAGGVAVTLQKFE